MERRDSEMKDGCGEKRGRGVGGRARTCQGNVCRGHGSWNSGMAQQIAAVFSTPGRILGFIWYRKPQSPPPHHDRAVFSSYSCIDYCLLSIVASSLSPTSVYTGMLRLLSRRNIALCAQTHADTSEFPVQPCRQSFRAVAAG